MFPGRNKYGVGEEFCLNVSNKSTGLLHSFWSDTWEAHHRVVLVRRNVNRPGGGAHGPGHQRAACARCSATAWRSGRWKRPGHNPRKQDDRTKKEYNTLCRLHSVIHSVVLFSFSTEYIFSIFPKQFINATHY